MASTQVYVKWVGVWMAVPATDVVITRSLTDQSATFRVEDANVLYRVALNQWSEVHIAMEREGSTLKWAGVVMKAKVEVASPVSFSLAVTCAGMEKRAEAYYQGALNFSPGTVYIGSDETDMLRHTWDATWVAVDRSRVVADPLARTYEDDQDQQLQFRYADLKSMTDKIVREFVHDYHWWLEWDGNVNEDGTLYLRAEVQGHVDNGRVLTGDDLQFQFEMEPTNLDVRNSIIAVGGQSDVLEPTAPIAQSGQDLNSVDTFGLLWLVVVDPSMDRQTIVDDRVSAEMVNRAWPFWKLEPAVFDYDIELNELVTLDLPGLGLDGVNFGKKYVVAAITDEMKRGFARRKVLFMEDYFSNPVG